MPLPDALWERGKCGYKLIQYMASGKPVVASPVGENVNIVSNGINGFLADSAESWRDALLVLVHDSELRRAMGLAGRSLVESKYSLKVTAPRLTKLMQEAVAHHPPPGDHAADGLRT
jgi:glycosyltransferase involved in cell wall biosynthesis